MFLEEAEVYILVEISDGPLVRQPLQTRGDMINLGDEQS